MAKERRIEIYNLNPTKCLYCKNNFEYSKRKQKFCNHSCSACYTNGGRPKSINNCIVCFSSLGKPKLYCGHKCHEQDKYSKFILSWQNGFENGASKETLSAYIRKFIWQKYDFKCAKCDWCTPHPLSGIPPLQIDHINGNALDNRENNLILLCPNCHALTETYGNRNQGKGRSGRRAKYLRNP